MSRDTVTACSTVHTVLILSRHASRYRDVIQQAELPRVNLLTSTDPAALDGPEAGADIVLGEPSLIAAALPRLPRVRWVQSTWAGVEPLLAPSMRRDYILTNARGVFGGLMCEYVFGYLIAHERRMFEKYEAQKAGRWDATLPGALRGKQIGLLGVGSIGAELARTAKYFGLRVKGFTRASEDCPHVDAYYHGEARAAFAADLDYLVSVMPTTTG